jgi:tetratricopeptide (TPR) repeat protein
MLLGVGLLLSTDAVAPEFIPKGLRFTSVALGIFAAIALLYTGWVEAHRAMLRGALMKRDLPAQTSLANSLRSMGAYDGEVWALIARSATETEPLRSLERAARLSPSTRTLRALARAQAEAGQETAANATLSKALALDPNNLLTLTQLLNLNLQSKDLDNEESVARRLVSVEQTPYFQIRSIPDLVPLETANAKLFLAERAKGDERAKLMQSAIDQYREYATRTVPSIKQMSEADPPMDYGGQTMPDALRAMEIGQAKARELAATYRALGRGEDAAKAEELAKGFAEAGADLTGSAK